MEEMLPEYNFATMRERPNRFAKDAGRMTHRVVVDKALWPATGQGDQAAPNGLTALRGRARAINVDSSELQAEEEAKAELGRSTSGKCLTDST